MADRIDRILDVLDVGLQQSTETGEYVPPRPGDIDYEPQPTDSRWVSDNEYEIRLGDAPYRVQVLPIEEIERRYPSARR